MKRQGGQCVATQIQSDNDMIAECRRLWEMAKVSLPDEAVTCNISDQRGYGLDEEGNDEEAKVLSSKIWRTTKGR